MTTKGEKDRRAECVKGNYSLKRGGTHERKPQRGGEKKIGTLVRHAVTFSFKLPKNQFPY